VTGMGTWWSGHQCYAAPYNAPPGDPAWQGHTDGSLWQCSNCVSGAPATCRVQILWLALGNASDPGRLARTAVGLLPLVRADVHTAPQAPEHTYVGVENWLWVPRTQWVTLSKTVTAGGTSVTVTAMPRQVVWDMGPGSIRCYAPGTVWRREMTDAARTSCSYTYAATSDSEPNGEFAIAATIRYQVDWICAGACSTGSGSLGLVDAPAGGGAMRVLQRQTVVVQ
jgi:hypothetical protein